MDMKTMIGFAAGCLFAITTAAIAVETSDIGRYQISSTSDGTIIFEAIIDTSSGEVVARHRTFVKNYDKL